MVQRKHFFLYIFHFFQTCSRIMLSTSRWFLISFNAWWEYVSTSVFMYMHCFNSKFMFCNIKISIVNSGKCRKHQMYMRVYIWIYICGWVNSYNMILCTSGAAWYGTYYVHIYTYYAFDNEIMRLKTTNYITHPKYYDLTRDSKRFEQFKTANVQQSNEKLCLLFLIIKAL